MLEQAPLHGSPISALFRCGPFQVSVLRWNEPQHDAVGAGLVVSSCALGSWLCRAHYRACYAVAGMDRYVLQQPPRPKWSASRTPGQMSPGWGVYPSVETHRFGAHSGRRRSALSGAKTPSATSTRVILLQTESRDRRRKSRAAVTAKLARVAYSLVKFDQPCRGRFEVRLPQ